MLPALEALDHIGQAGRCLGEVGRVDLGDVAQADDLGPRACPGGQRLHLLGREVLCLVDDQVLVVEGAAAHERHGFDADARADQVGGGRPAPFAAGAALVQHLQVVFQRAHPGRHLLFLGAGQEADVVAYRHGGAGHDDFGEAFLVQGLGQARRQGQQRLASTGLAEQGHEVDVRIEQQVQRKVLLAVAGRDAPDGVARLGEVAHHAQHGGVALALAYLGEQWCAAIFQIEELVDEHLRHQRATDAVETGAIVLPGFHVPAVGFPEVGGQGERAAVEQVEVVGDLIIEVVLGRQTQRAGLDAHVDVLRHQHHLLGREHLAQGGRHRQDAVVGLAGGQRLGQRGVEHARLQEQPPGGVTVAQPVQGDALFDAAFHVGQQLVEAAADLPCMARDLAHAALVVVQLFQRDHRQEHVVLLEAEQCRRVVHQHVGVQHEQLAGGGVRAGGPVTAVVRPGALAASGGGGRGDGLGCVAGLGCGAGPACGAGRRGGEGRDACRCWCACWCLGRYGGSRSRGGACHPRCRGRRV